MLRTYKAKLRGNHLEWIEAPPQMSTIAEAVDVHVTILDQPSIASDAPAQGVRMADILAQLAQRQTFVAIPDPVAWERDLRTDHELPDRAA